MSYVLQKKALCELLQVTRVGLRNWQMQGAPLGPDLSGDPVEVCSWYVSVRPVFTFSVAVAMRQEFYRDLGLRLLKERKAARKAVEAAQ